MSHGRGSVPAPKDDQQPHLTPLRRLLGAVRRHFTTWPRRYVEMRVGRRQP